MHWNCKWFDNGKVTVTDSNAATAFPIVFNDESDALLDDTGTFTYTPSTGTLAAAIVNNGNVTLVNLTVSGEQQLLINDFSWW